MTLALTRPEAQPMIQPLPNTEPPQIPPRLLRRVWRQVVLDYAYGLFRVYREGWPTTPKAHTTYGVPQEAPTPSGSGALQVYASRAVLWFGLEYTVGEDRAITSTRYGEALNSLHAEDRQLILSWLGSGNFPNPMGRGTESAFERLATASGLGLGIAQGRQERRALLAELFEPLAAERTPLNARVRRRA